MCEAAIHEQFASRDVAAGAIKYKLRRPKSDCRGYIRIGHLFQGDCASSASRLLHPRDGLIHPFPACLAVGGLELWQLQPPQERIGPDSVRPAMHR